MSNKRDREVREESPLHPQSSPVNAIVAVLSKNTKNVAEGTDASVKDYKGKPTNFVMITNDNNMVEYIKFGLFTPGVVAIQECKNALDFVNNLKDVNIKNKLSSEFGISNSIPIITIPYTDITLGPKQQGENRGISSISFQGEPLTSNNLPNILDNSLEIVLSSTFCDDTVTGMSTAYALQEIPGLVILFMLTIQNGQVEIASILTAKFKLGKINNDTTRIHAGLTPNILAFCTNQDARSRGVIMRAGWMVKIFIALCVYINWTYNNNAIDLLGIKITARPEALDWWAKLKYKGNHFISYDSKEPREMEMDLSSLISAPGKKAKVEVNIGGKSKTNKNKNLNKRKTNKKKTNKKKNTNKKKTNRKVKRSRRRTRRF